MLAVGSFWYTVLVLFFLLIGAVTPTYGTEKTVNVTFINPGFQDKGFWKAVTDTMTAASEQLGFDLDVHYSDRQWPAMVQKAERVIDSPEKTDFLILVNEHQQAAALLEKADAAGIPTLMLLNSLTQEQIKTHGMPREKLSNWLGSITPDNQIAGYEMATSLLAGNNEDQAARESKIAVLTLAGDNATPASIHRLSGLDRALQEHVSLIEARRISVNWSREEAYKRTQLWLENKQMLSAVWAANDPIALGAIRAIKENGLVPGKDVLVSGLNWSPEAIRAVLNEEMTLTHGGHFLAGAWAMVMLYDYIHGLDFKDIGTDLSFPMTAIHSGNAQKYLDLFGDGDWRKVDFTQFTRKHSEQDHHYEFTLGKLLEAADNGR